MSTIDMSPEFTPEMHKLLRHHMTKMQLMSGCAYVKLWDDDLNSSFCSADDYGSALFSSAPGDWKRMRTMAPFILVGKSS